MPSLGLGRAADEEEAVPAPTLIWREDRKHLSLSVGALGGF